MIFNQLGRCYSFLQNLNYHSKMKTRILWNGWGHHHEVHLNRCGLITWPPQMSFPVSKRNVEPAKGRKIFAKKERLNVETVQKRKIFAKMGRKYLQKSENGWIASYGTMASKSGEHFAIISKGFKNISPPLPRCHCSVCH